MKERKNMPTWKKKLENTETIAPTIELSAPWFYQDQPTRTYLRFTMRGTSLEMFAIKTSSVWRDLILKFVTQKAAELTGLRIKDFALEGWDDRPSVVIYSDKHFAKNVRI